MVNTVEQNKNRLAHDVKRTENARKTQDLIGRPSTSKYLSIIANNLLPNCKVTINDITMAEDIFGNNLGSLKGKTTRGRPTHVEVHQPNPIPITIMDKYNEFTLAINVIFINNIPFFTSISQHIKFGTAERLINRQASNLMKAIKGICNVHALRAFTITLVLGDNEVESLRGELAQHQIQLNTAAPDEHVPEIERFNCTIKD
jgi:hypothetical protein